jgi:ABC-2 type transport system permease protein
MTLSSFGARLLIGVLGEFFMGGLIPIPLMPEWLQQILNWLPFRYIADLPFRVYSGNISGQEALFQMGIQLVWLLALLLIGKLWLRKILRHVVIQGG